MSLMTGVWLPVASFSSFLIAVASACLALIGLIRDSLKFSQIRQPYKVSHPGNKNINYVNGVKDHLVMY